MYSSCRQAGYSFASIDVNQPFKHRLFAERVGWGSSCATHVMLEKEQQLSDTWRQISLWQHKKTRRISECQFRLTNEFKPAADYEGLIGNQRSTTSSRRLFHSAHELRRFLIGCIVSLRYSVHLRRNLADKSEPTERDCLTNWTSSLVIDHYFLYDSSMNYSSIMKNNHEWVVHAMWVWYREAIVDCPRFDSHHLSEECNFEHLILSVSACCPVPRASRT